MVVTKERYSRRGKKQEDREGKSAAVKEHIKGIVSDAGDQQAIDRIWDNYVAAWAGVPVMVIVPLFVV
jgi:hypothetical protein